jgi:glutathione S-transferase
MQTQGLSTMRLTLCEFPTPSIPNLESFSPFCLKVHRALKVAELPYTSRHSGDPSAFKSLNPARQVPILLIENESGQEVISDSSRIVDRIERLSPERFAATNRIERAEAELWEELADTALNGFLVASRWADDRNWQRTKSAYFVGMPGPVAFFIVPRIRARVLAGLYARDIWRQGPDACWERFTAILDQMDARAPKTDYWVGTKLSRADVAIFAQLHSLRTELTVWQRDQLASRRNLSAYLDRVDAATR